jgi:hypothetical protein
VCACVCVCVLANVRSHVYLVRAKEQLHLFQPSLAEDSKIVCACKQAFKIKSAAKRAPTTDHGNVDGAGSC